MCCSAELELVLLNGLSSDSHYKHHKGMATPVLFYMCAHVFWYKNFHISNYCGGNGISWNPGFELSCWFILHINVNLWHLLIYSLFSLPSSTTSTYLKNFQVKRIHEYKRQLLNILGIVYCYKKMKEMTAVERQANYVPRVCIFGGKAFATYVQAKRIVKFITDVGATINHDPEIGDLLKVWICF